MRCVEETGPLDDSEALHAAFAASTYDEHRLVVRARILGERLDLPAAIEKTRQAAPWVLIGLALLVVVAGAGLAGKVVGAEDGSRRINVIAALGSLLGLHLFTLAVWLVGLVWSPDAWRHSLGGWWLGLSARIAAGRTGQAPLLLRAATRLLTRARMLPWALGLVSHAVWTLSFAVALGGLLFALAFRRYTLGWETTILAPDFFVRLVQGLGYLPSLLGFPVPSAASILAASNGAALVDAGGQRDWALWMTGCLALYGLVPRLVLALGCLALLRERRGAALHLDLQAPYYRQLLLRIAALRPATQIVDADPGLHGSSADLAGLPAEVTADMRMAIGFELASGGAWPPPAWPGDAQSLPCDGSANARAQVLAQVASAAPRRVLLVCDMASSPDRGTERFVRELMARSGGVDVWLRPPAAADAAAPDDAAAPTDADSFGGFASSADALAQRWQTWLAGTGLPVRIVFDPAAWIGDARGPAS